MTTPTTARPPRGVTGLGALTIQLTAARFRTREGESLLYVAGVLASTVAAALALTVAGGTWLFWGRSAHPTGLLAKVIAEDETFHSITIFYFALAIIACALLVPALVNLVAGAAVLGARGRERRLSALRLLGLSSGDVVRMSLLDATLQAVIGIVLGSVVYAVTLPLWGNLEMLGMPLTAEEMLLPAWLFALVVAALLVIVLFATWRGLRQVRISPLGVARRANKPGLSAIRGVVFVVLVIGAVIVTALTKPGSALSQYVIIGGTILAVIVGINLVSPWLLQLQARVTAKLPWPSVMWASRRIVADPGATWRRVSGLAVLAFIGGYLALMPIAVSSSPEHSETIRTFADKAQWDFTKGAIITLAVGFVLTATSVLITQASATIERAEQSRALHRMGAPNGFSLRVMWLETFAPLVMAVVLSAGMGLLLALPMYKLARNMGVETGNGMALMGAVLVAGLVLAALSLLASHPLYRSLLGRSERAND